MVTYNNSTTSSRVVTTEPKITVGTVTPGSKNIFTTEPKITVQTPKTTEQPRMYIKEDTQMDIGKNLPHNDIDPGFDRGKIKTIGPEIDPGFKPTKPWDKGRVLDPSELDGTDSDDVEDPDETEIPDDEIDGDDYIGEDEPNNGEEGTGEDTAPEDGETSEGSEEGEEETNPSGTSSGGPSNGASATKASANYNIQLDHATLNSQKNELASAAAEINRLWNEIKGKEMSTVSSVWNSADGQAYTNKVNSFDPKVKASVEALQLLSKTYERADNELLQTQGEVTKDINQL